MKKRVLIYDEYFDVRHQPAIKILQKKGDAAIKKWINTQLNEVLRDGRILVGSIELSDEI